MGKLMFMLHTKHTESWKSPASLSSENYVAPNLVKLNFSDKLVVYMCLYVSRKKNLLLLKSIPMTVYTTVMEDLL